MLPAPHRTRRPAAAALLVAALLASGCASDLPQRPCPDVAILRDAERAVLFRDGPGRDLTDVRYEVSIAGVTPQCVFKGDTLTSTVAIDIVAARGPAAEGDEGVFHFFVAVLDSGSTILNKQVFETRVPLPAGSRRAGVREQIDQILQLKSGEDGLDYQILVGLQLDPSQLRYNRDQRER